jgi:hypothetical protein
MVHRLRPKRCSMHVICDLMEYLASAQTEWRQIRDFWSGSRANLRKIADQELTLTIGYDTIRPMGMWWATLACGWTQSWPWSSISRRISGVCYYLPHCLRQIRRLEGQDVTLRIFLTLMRRCWITACLPKRTISMLQWVQNAAAHLTYDLDPRDFRFSSAKSITLTTYPVY